MARPNGSKQIMPSSGDIKRWIAVLREKADQGDPAAIKALLDMRNEQGLYQTKERKC